MPVTHSTPSSESLSTRIEREYDLGPLVGCKLWRTGLNDTYLITTQERELVLKLFRGGPLDHTGWRTLPSIRFEVDLLVHLVRKGAPVAAPVPARDGGFTLAVELPEGVRHAVLYTYADGRPCSLGEEQSY